MDTRALGFEPLGAYPYNSHEGGNQICPVPGGYLLPPIITPPLQLRYPQGLSPVLPTRTLVSPELRPWEVDVSTPTSSCVLPPHTSQIDKPVLQTASMPPVRHRNVKLQKKFSKMDELERGCALRDVFGVELPPELQ